ncbi:MAG: hypothetical protein QW112_00700 [Candidatus Micrarchaeia archaeon]
MKYKKGQFFSYDAVMAGALLSILIALLFIYWSSTHSLVFNQVDDMYRVGIAVSDTLLTPGSPANWNSANVHQVGLTDEFGSMNLNSQKVSRLYNYASGNYYGFQEKFGASRYNLFITIDGYPNSIGMPPMNPTGLITIRRPVLYDGHPSTLTVVVWMNYTV